MQNFEIETFLPIAPDRLKEELLTMSGVNYELAPIIRMSAPEKWRSEAITNWPVDQELFTSTICLFGFIPIDRHYFKLVSLSDHGFVESSSSLMNSLWSHERTIVETGTGAKIKDAIAYQCKLAFLGPVLKPIYRAIFAHRHRRLKRKYA